MRAWVVNELGGVDALRMTACPAPAAPGPGEATVAMAAVGLNYPDLLMLSGRYQFRPDLPFVPGTEGVGRVVALGEGLAADLLGRRVMVGARAGLLAEQVTLPVAALRATPEALDDGEAACFTVGALTAWVALMVRGRLSAKDRLMVLGAGGGMGLAAVALGSLMGARVTAVASHAGKIAAARAAGAADGLVVDRAAPDLSAANGLFDLVFDPVGGPLVRPALGALGRGGRYLVVGFAGGWPDPLPTDLVHAKELDIIGVRAGEAGRQDPAAGARHMAAIDGLATAGRLRPAIGMRVPFEAAPAAFRAMAAGAIVGKCAITMP